MNELFITSDDESDNGPPLKKAKSIRASDRSDLDSESDFEDISLQSVIQQLPIQDEVSEFNITINSVDDEQKEKLKRLIKEKQRRISLKYLGTIVYTLHAWQRNKLLSNTKVLKALKKLLPDLFMMQYKSSKNATDEHLVYIIKYLIKWFRKNFKHDSNGLRVLGYLPKKMKLENDYFPKTQNLSPL